MISSITKSTLGSLALGLLFISSTQASPQNDQVTTAPTTTVAAPAKADSSTFTVGAQIRPRFEYRHGFKRPQLEGQKAASFIEQRSRVWFDYKTNKFRIHLNLQDVRMWGSTNQIYKSDPSMFNAYEAYGEYFINDKWGVRFGRQALNYDNARFMGNLDWAQQGRSHDAVLIKFEDKAKKLKIHIGGGMNQFQSEPSYLQFAPYTNNNNKFMAYVWANKDWGKFSSSFLFHNDGREQITQGNNADTLLHSRQTIALIPTYKMDKVKLDGEFYYQMGKNGGGQEVSAYFFSVAATFDTKITPITVGVDYASGTDAKADNNVDNSWNPLYGTNHKFYGFMDYFYVGNQHGQLGRTSGLTDIFVKTNFKLGKSKKHFLAAHLHYFMSPVDIYDPTDLTGNTVASSGLGTEIDLVWKWKISKNVVGNVGYSQMFATETMQMIKNGQFDPINGAAKTAGMNNWAWMQINFNTELFKFKHKN